MTRAVVLAGVAAVLGVAAAWDALVALERAHVVRRIGVLLGPFGRAVRRVEEPSAADRRRLVLLGAAALFAAGWLLAGAALGLLLAAGGPVVVGRVLAVRRRRRRAALARAAPAVARALADALAAGHSIRAGIGIAARHGGLVEPAAGELRRAAAALAVGATTEATLEALRSDADDPGWDTLVAAVLLQREAGGDLAGLLRAIAGALEDAARVRADAASATAQARFTAWLVAGLPFGAATLAELGAPGALATIAARPAAAALAVSAVVLQLVAFIVIRRLAQAATA